MPEFLHPPVISVVEARTQLPGLLAQFREQGDGADPVAIGRHRRPDAVLVPYSLWLMLIRLLEDVATPPPTDSGADATELDLDALAHAAGVGLDLVAAEQRALDLDDVDSGG